MKNLFTLLLLTIVLAASIAGCARRDVEASPSPTTTGVSVQSDRPSSPVTTPITPPVTTPPVTTPPVTTPPVTTPPVTTPPVTTPPVTTPPVTTPPVTTPPVTTPPVTTPPVTTPKPLPGNPEQYGFTEVPSKKLDAWFHFKDSEHWSFWYTTQTNIGDSLNLSLLKPCTYDEATQNWIPSADAYEKGWRASKFGSTMVPITGMSAVLAFTAPEDGTYEFEFYICAGNLPGTDSDGLQFILCDKERTYVSQYFYNGDVDEMYDPDMVKYISLKKGERAYFVIDPLLSGVGDICKHISMIRVQRTIENYIDNKNIYAFGYSYDEGSNKQGTNGWYAGYAGTGSPLTSASIGSDPMPSDLLAGSTSFSSVKEDEIAMILWKAPKSGTYTVSVRGWWPDKDVFLSFYNDGEWITTLQDDFSSANHQMTCKLNKGEYFALLITRNEAFNGWGPDNDLEILIQRAS